MISEGSVVASLENSMNVSIVTYVISIILTISYSTSSLL